MYVKQCTCATFPLRSLYNEFIQAPIRFIKRSGYVQNMLRL